MSRELKDFVSAFQGGMKLGLQKKQADAYDDWRKSQTGKSPDAWTPAHEAAYKQQYGTDSGIPVTGGASSRGGVGSWIKKQLGLKADPAAGAYAPAADSSSVVSAIPNRNDALGQAYQTGQPAAYDANAPTPLAASDVTPGDVYEESAATGGVMKGTNDYVAGRQRAENDGQPVLEAPPPADPNSQLPPPEQPTTPILYGEDGQPTGIHMAPMSYPGADAARAPIRASESAPPATAIPTQGGAKGAVGAPSGAPTAPRKALTDQTRTEAYDPDLDANDPDNVLTKALDGGLQYAIHTFHLKGDGVAVGKDPHQAGGQRAVMGGMGAADPQSVHDMNEVVKATSADKQRLEGPMGQAILGMRRLEIVYQHYVQTGQTDKANKAAFELMQYGAGEAAKLGTMATGQLRSGDATGATNTIVKALDEIPDGRKVTVGPDGKTAIWTDTRTGKVVGEYKFAPKDLFDMALGLSNRSTYWNVLMQRAQMTNPALQKEAKTAGAAELNQTRIDLNKARIDKLKQGKAGPAAAVASPLAAQLEEIDAKRVTRPAASAGTGTPTTEPAAPAQPGGGETPAPRDEAMDDAEHGSDAPADLKNRPAPASVLRVKPATPGQSVVPAEDVAPPAAPVAPPGKYDTKLTPAEEAQYQKWAAGNPTRQDTSDYDMRGFWKSKGAQADNGHYPDTFKKPSHPTFSNESQYHGKDDNEGGQWTELDKGKWAFQPGRTNVNNGLDKTTKYLKDNDPGVELRAPAEDKLDGVPDVVIHNGKPVAMSPGKAPDFHEPHPLQPFNGRNPYTAILADPKNSPWFATKQGKSDKTGLTRKAGEIDRDVQDWDRRRKEYVAEFGKAHAADIATQRAEAKKVYDKPIDPMAAQRLTAEHIDPAIEALAKPDADPNVIKDGALKPTEASKMTLELLERNRAMPVGHAVNMLNELTRSGTPGEDDKKWRSFTPKGKDLVGNVIVQLNGDKSVELHLAPSTYEKINSVVESRYRKKKEAAKKPQETNLIDKIKNLEEGTFGLADKASAYLRPSARILMGPNMGKDGGVNTIYHDAATVGRKAYAAGQSLAAGAEHKPVSDQAEVEAALASNQRRTRAINYSKKNY